MLLLIVISMKIASISIRRFSIFNNFVVILILKYTENVATISMSTYIKVARERCN